MTILGHKHSEETKRKMAEKARLRTGSKNPHWRGGLVTLNCLFCGEEFQVYPGQKDTRIFCSYSCKGKGRGERVSNLTRERMSLARISHPPWNKGFVGYKEAYPEWYAKLWKDKDVMERRAQAALQATITKPTSLEQKLIGLIKLNDLPFRYVGNGEVWIAGKCPDFLNTNGKKQLIEVFGVYWHPIFDVAKRTEHFRQYGFQTLIIWEDELADEAKVLKKIKQFVRLG